MDPNRFDAIARTLGTERSRRGMLKTLGAAALGALGVATASRGTAAAPGSPGGNSACAQFCAAVFGADTPPAGQCTSDAAHGTGTCVACNGDPNNYCDGACTDIQTDTSNCGGCGNACPVPANGSATCAGGQCGFTCDASHVACGTGCVSACPAGSALNTATCSCETAFPSCSNGQACGSTTNSFCGANCFCLLTVAGQSVCLKPFGFCGTPCTSNDQCNGGICLAAPCCGETTGGTCVSPNNFCAA